jgi:hypothetical protein
MRRFLVMTFVFVVVLPPAALEGQLFPHLPSEIPIIAPQPAPFEYGTQDLVMTSLGSMGFATYALAANFPGYEGYQLLGGFRRTITNGGVFSRHLELPQGALVEMVEFEACDSTDQAQLVLIFGACNGTLGTCPIIRSVATGVPEAPGCGRFLLPIDPAVQIDNQIFNYILEVNDPEPNSPGTSFIAARVFWRRQVSPSPATPTFDDVPPSHPYFQFIEAVAASGIAPECEPFHFCPGSVVTRGELAAFLARALGLHWLALPQP